ncbi:MAG TPA: hypothetical protein PK831_00040 [Candidatus Magasanikbacteria bacterium]|nr:hypothetical protein [Candidatus Magasanikbacteria bacterium]
MNNKIKFKKISKLFILGFILFIGIFYFTPVLAQSNTVDTFGIEAIEENISLGGDDIRVTVAKIIRAVLGLLGLIAVIVVIYGGFVYLTSGGEEDKIAKGKKILINGVIGLVIILMSFIIVQFLLNKLSEATGLVDKDTIDSRCSNTEFALLNPDICYPGGLPDICELKHFVVTSITPVTNNTGMNNVAIRVIFSRKINYEDGDITIKQDGSNISDDFVFEVKGIEAGYENSLVEAQYNGTSTCADETKCLPSGRYEVEVSRNVSDNRGNYLETEIDCGDYPNIGSFTINNENNFIKDETKPLVEEMRLVDGSKLDGSYLLAGEVYEFFTEIRDKINTLSDGGAGYVQMNLKKVDSNSTGYNFFAGPSIARGSDTTDENPYKFEYKRLNIPKNAKPLESFLLTLDVFDIDNNHTTVTSTFTIIADHCRNGVKDGDEIDIDVGGSCGSIDFCIQDSDCPFTYRCVDSEPVPIPPATSDYRTKTCQPFPYIQEVDPMDGGSGNWISILGYNFGSYRENDETGIIEFGLDTNNDDQPDKWVPADIVSCGDDNKPSWNSSWIVIEVPENNVLPEDSLSAIRLTTARKIKINGEFQKLQDTTIDDWGENPGPRERKGWFLKNNIVRPGLCKVENEKATFKGTSLGMVSDPVKATGKGFGGSGSLYFANVQSNITGWSESWITSFVPNLDKGKVPVLVESGKQRSNKVPFEIITEEDDVIPVITIIDPVSTTPGSYLTIIGRNFGNSPGAVYLSNNKGGLKCENDSDCIEMALNMPEFCENTWSDNQIIVEVPEVNFVEESNFIKKYITVKNESGSFSSGDNDFEIHNGSPLPSICNLFPSGGPAPLATGKNLTLKGINFSSDPTVYFFTEKSELKNKNSTKGWLYSSKNSVFTLTWRRNLDDDKGEIVETPIPYDQNFGYSMRTGMSPIKLKDNSGNFSNSVYYNVTDCRKATSSVPTGFQCCLEGEEAGQIKPNNIGCIGEPKNAGYVWRFTTGLLPNNPYVVVSCDEDKYESTTEFPSPIPSVDWKSGRNACVNSIIAVRFGPKGINMDKSSINASTVKVYKCNSVLDDNQELDKDSCVLLSLEENCAGLGCLVLKNNILEIYIPPENYLNNTWYHVELMKDIRSREEIIELGNTKVKFLPLRVDRELKDPVDKKDKNNVAFYFNFRTGGEKCVLTSAFMIPTKHTTNLLGVVQNPKYAFDFNNIFNPPHPLYYYLSGKGDQECSVIDVDGLGWEWNTSKEDQATVEKAPSAPSEKLKKKYTDSRGLVTALQNTYPEDVTISAVTTTLQDSSDEDNNKKTITATSSLMIDLSEPKVIEYWPNCIEACINTQIAARFNMLMMTSTYRNGVELSQCADENCNSNDIIKNIDVNVGTDDSDWNTIRFYPKGNTLLEPNTWYLVKLNKNIKSIGGFVKDEEGKITEIIEGKPLNEFKWKFKTKNDSSPCLAESVDIIPNPLYVYSVGGKNKIQAQPNGSPDSCSPYGQALNPWFFTWSWSSFNTDVFEITNLSTSHSLNPYCGKNCLFKGSDIPRGTENVFVCGNGIVEPGEDCDIALENNVPISCDYNCLRPGNLDFVAEVAEEDIGKCGDGHVNKNLGEECDPGIPEQRPYCTNKCQWKGSSQIYSGEPEAAYCGSGSVTLGEDCDIAIDKIYDDKGNIINTSKFGCSDNCLHLGTKLSQAWCDENANKNTSALEACKNAVSVCGNRIIETGEECEIGVYGATSSTCDINCLLKDVCDSPLKQCDKDEEGCNSDCTLAGSSALYSTPSVCGDGQSEIGEEKKCEVDPADLVAQYGISASGVLGQSPVQITTAIGESLESIEIPGLNGIKGQSASSSAKTVGYFDNEKIIQLSGADIKEGLGDYHLVCGFNEFFDLQDGKYNLCPGNEKNQKGVGKNSCCFVRPKRVSQYPEDGEGFGNGPGVCRNTYIEAVVNNYLDLQTVNNRNFVLVSGHEDSNHECSTSSIDLTEEVDKILGKEIMGSVVYKPISFLGKIWHGIKTFFARLFGVNANAENTYSLVKDINVWCSVPIELSLDVDIEFKTKTLASGTETLDSATTTISAYLKDLLDKDTVYGVVMFGGAKGIKDYRGVGIKNANEEIFSINDLWLFKTGDQICKIDEVSVVPDNYLFDAPNNEKSFRAEAKNADNAKIVSTPAYEWEWSWGPTGHPVFDIPNNHSVTNTIKVRNLEGSVFGVAQAKITNDISQESNHTGKIFTGLIELNAMFCENPWPLRGEGNTWRPYTDKYYGFSFSYCADKGMSGNTADDLPYFNSFSLLHGELTATSTLSTELERNKIIGRNIVDNASPTIAEGGDSPTTLQRILYFNETNDDVLGIQIFENEQGFESSAASWYASYFPEAPAPTNITISSGKRSYEGVKEGNNYYINAQNIVQENGDFVAYNNILAFSVNEGATQDTLNVLAQIIDSLALNLNVNDFGYCLTDGLVGITKLPMDPKIQAAISDVSCSSDFDCRDTNGNPLKGTNGICSNAETKFFRDIKRLEDINTIQEALDKYFVEHPVSSYDFKADLKGGTYIPGYTVSTWPSWNNTLGSYLKDYLSTDRLPLGEINTWTACTDINAESQTCWNATESTYSCPAYSHVFEYEYVSSTGSYLLHSPLEFLSVDSRYASGINTSRFTEDPYCKGESFSLKAGVCGDGIIQPGSGEECDPPGSKKIGTEGYINTQYGNCNYEGYNKECLSDAYCLDFSVFGDNGVEKIVPHDSQTKVCQTSNGGVVYNSDLVSDDNRYPFVCLNDDYCKIGTPFMGDVAFQTFGEGLSGQPAGSNMDFKCDTLANATYFVKNVPPAQCIGAVIGRNVACDTNQSAVSTCNSNCKVELGICQSYQTCGNGIVEIGEACDDGALNGQYGQCADENSKKADGVTPVGACQGLHGQYCGNGVLDTKNGSPLEVCENLGDKLYLSYSNNIGKCNNDENRLCNISGNCSLSDSYALKFTNLKDPDTGGITKQWVAGNFEKLGLLVGNDLPNDFAVQIWFKKTETNDQDETFLIIAPDVMNPDSSGIVMKFLKKENVGSLVGNRFQVKYDYVDPKGVIKSDTIVTPPLFIWDEIKKESKWVLLTFSYNASVADNKIRLTYNQDSVDKYPGNSNNNYFVMPMSKDKTNVGIILGSFKPGEVDYFNGILDSFKIYHDLSSWPATDYNNGLGYLNMDGVGKVSALWSFDQGGGSVVKEDSNPDINRNLVLSANGMWIESEVARQGRCVEKKKQYTLLNFSEPNSLSQDSLDNICLIPGNLCSVDKYTKEMANYFGSTFANLTNDKSFANKYCSDDHTILCKTSADCVIPQDKNLVSNYLSVLKNGFDNFSLEYKNVGDCVDVISTPAASYNFNKQYSCKWDCQDYGQYCGDGTRNGDEECDFNDPNMKDRCDSQCRIIVDPIICGDGQVGGNEVCDTGKYCENITEKDLAKVCNSDSDCAGIGDGKCITRNIKYKDGNDQFVCSADCRTKTPYVSSCGNGILDQGEFCDTGANVGKVCEPGYGKSCNYCSADCSRVFTIDSPKYCGNGKIDEIESGKFETCDRLSDGTVIVNDEANKNKSEGTRKICPDKGRYTCTDCTANPGNECYSCEEGYDIPKLDLINVTGKKEESNASNAYYLYFLRWNNPNKTKIIYFTPIYNYSSVLNLMSGDKGINFSDDCKNEFAFGFGSCIPFFRVNTTIDDNSGEVVENFGMLEDNEIVNTSDVFDFSKDGSKDLLYSNFIFSPAVPEGTFRIVVVWEDDDFYPNINIYHDWFKLSGDSAIINTIKGMSNLCAANFPEDECQDILGGKVYFHPHMKGQNSNLKTSAVTINTKGMSGGKYKIFISNLNNLNNDKNIGKFKNSNIKVYLYKYHEGQSKFSIYKPDKIYDISQSDGSNEDAKYWHVLDLDKNLFTDFYKVSEIRENHDGEILTNYSEITEDSNKFILDPSIISNIVNKIEPGKLYIYTDVFGYQKGADNEKKSINNFYVYHLFNNKKSQINNKYNISTIISVKKLTEQPYQLPILYFKNENIGNDIKIDRINNKDIYYANGILITELSDCITDYYKNVQEFKRSNKMIYSYSLNLIYSISWKNGFFNKDIYKYTFISPKILYKDNLDNIIVKEIPATYLNKSIADTMIKGDVDNAHSNNHYIYNFFNFTFDYSQNNKPKIIIEPVNEFMSYEDSINL